MRFVVATLMVLLAGCVKRVRTADTTIVFTAKRVHTNDPKRPIAQAIAWKHGSVVAVGSRAEVMSAVDDDVVVEDFPDSVIVPGLVDSHGHLSSLGRALSVVSLEGTKSAEEVIERVKKAPASAFQGEWLVGRGWDQNDWKQQDFPNRTSLDAAFPSVPVVLTRVDGHAAWVNAEALRRSGITAKTAEPTGGRILRDAKGEPTGVLIDNAIDLVTIKMTEPTDEQLQQRLKLALEACARLGLTQVHDAGMDLRTLRILQSWDMLGVLPLRIYAMVFGQNEHDAEQFIGLGTFGGRHVEVRAVKLVLDGALGSRGAALNAPYSDEPTSKGHLLLTPDEFRARAKAFSDAGFQVAVHAIGDLTNALAIDVLKDLNGSLRHRVEHAQVLRAEDVEKFAKYGLIASFQPTHATSDMPWAEQRLGPERTKFAYAWRSVLSTGAHVTFGSDFPVESPNPLLGLYAARTRRDASGAPKEGWMPEQTMTGEEALAGFTTGGAYASFAEKRRGRLEAGFDADLVVLPIDPVTDAPEKLLDAKVQVTVVGGVDVYRAK
ncbi:MAG: amidohydrolase [Archangium sp.]